MAPVVVSRVRVEFRFLRTQNVTESGKDTAQTRFAEFHRIRLNELPIPDSDTGPKPLWRPEPGVPDGIGKHITPAIRKRHERERRREERRPRVSIDDEEPTAPFRRDEPVDPHSN